MATCRRYSACADQTRPAPWDNSVCRVAAQRGHWEVLLWLLLQEPHCPYSEEARQLVSERLDIEVVQEF